MRALIQRIENAEVSVNKLSVGKANKGVLILLGIGAEDSESDILKLSTKILNLRIFNDSEGKMNLSLLEIKGDALIISQFTLYANCKKGNRPSFTYAAPPKLANDLYLKFVQHFEKQCLGKVSTGIFGENMDVSLLNQGPVTIWLDTADF